MQFSPETLADIFLGKIKRWDDPLIKADNAGVTLPAEEIRVVYRADASGTSAVFTEYLSAVSPEWKAGVGADKSTKWPVGQGGKGNEGVMGQIKQQPNTLGYTELTYAINAKLPVARIKNSAGKGKALADFLWWALHDGEKFARDLQYAPLPPEVVKRAEEKVNSMTGGGKPLRGQ